MGSGNQRHAEGASVFVRWKQGEKPQAMTVSTVKPKGYGVKASLDSVELHARESQVKPGERPRILLFSPQIFSEPLPREFQAEAEKVYPPCPVVNLMMPIAQPKPQKAARSKRYMKWVGSFPCCNCGAAPRSEAHHEGDKGMAQKCSDFLTVPLCASCHRIYTDENCLPYFICGIYQGRRLSREESLDLMHCEQDRLLALLFADLPRCERIDALERVMADLPAPDLQAALSRAERTS